MEKTHSPQDDLLHKVLGSAITNQIYFHRKESDPKVKHILSSETSFMRLGGLPGLLNRGKNKQRNKNLQSIKVNMDHRKKGPKLADLDLFIRPDGLPITFVVASSMAEQRRQVKIRH